MTKHEKMNQLREDFNSYLTKLEMSNYAFCRANGLPSSTLWTFLKGGTITQHTYERILAVANKTVYANVDTENEKNDKVPDNISLDTAVTKLMDEKIASIMSEIKELEDKLTKLKESKEIIRKLLD